MQTDTDNQEHTSTTSTATARTTGKRTSKRSAPAATAAKPQSKTAASATPEAEQDFGAPPPRDLDTTVDSLQRKAEAIVRLNGITFGTANGKRCIQTDRPLSSQDYDTLVEAMRKDLI